MDGDGKVGAFSDGFMVLRKMFGDAFQGEALCDKAMPPNATRTCSEIHEYIEELFVLPEDTSSMSAERLIMNNQSIEEEAQLELDDMCSCIDPIA